MSTTGQATVSLQIQLGGAGQSLAALAAQMQALAQAQANLLGAGGGGGGGPRPPPPPGGGPGLGGAANSLNAAIQALIRAMSQGANGLSQAAAQAAAAAAAAAAANAAAQANAAAARAAAPAPINPRTGQAYSLNAPGRTANNPAALNALVQSQYGGAGGARGGGGGGASNFQSQNLQAQAFDVFTQLGSGASPMLVVIQQGPQVIQALGGMGAAMDMLKAKLASLGISMQGMGVILGTLGAALTAGALVYRHYARETERILELRAAEHASVVRLIPLQRQLEDAQIRLLEATGAYSAQEAAAERIRVQAGRSVQDLARAHEQESIELRKTLVEGAKYVQWQRDLARGFAVITYASQVSTRGLSLDGLREYAAEVESVLDSVTGWAAGTEDAQRKLDILDKELQGAHTTAKEAAKTNIEADKATRDAAAGKRAAAAATRDEAKAERELAEVIRARQEVMRQAGRIELGAVRREDTRALADYSQQVYELVHAATAAGVGLEEIQGALDALAASYRTARIEAEAAATSAAMLGRMVEPGVAAMREFDTAIRAAYGQDKVDAALALADATIALSEAQRNGADPAAIAEGQRQIAEAQVESARRTAQAATQATAGAVASAINDPLGYLAGLDPTGISGAVVAGLHAAASNFSVLDDLTELFSNAAAGLASGGGKIAEFVASMAADVIPAVLQAVPDFVVGLLEEIPTIIEGVARALPRLFAASMEQLILLAPRVGIAIVQAMFDPATWLNAGKALGQGFLDAIADLWKTLRDLIEAVLPGRQFGGERTGLFKGGGVFDDVEYYTAGAVFGRGDNTGLFQADGWLGGLFGGRRDRRGGTTNVYQGGVVVIGSDAPRALQAAQTRYASVYGGP